MLTYSMQTSCFFSCKNIKQISLIFLVSLLSISSFAQVAAISGPSEVCVGANILLTDVTTGGIWTSSAPGYATVSTTSGLVTGISAGTATITYTVGASYITHSVAINSMPAHIMGPTSVCIGSPIELFDITPSGEWSSSNPA